LSERILQIIKNKISQLQYVMTIHAEEEMEDDELNIIDIEHSILNGKILERQKDRITAESKYRIQGETAEGIQVEIIVKLSPTGKVVIITVYVV
jgi:hypothetical protein